MGAGCAVGAVLIPIQWASDLKAAGDVALGVFRLPWIVAMTAIAIGAFAIGFGLCVPFLFDLGLDIRDTRRKRELRRARFTALLDLATEEDRSLLAKFVQGPGTHAIDYAVESFGGSGWSDYFDSLACVENTVVWRIHRDVVRMARARCEEWAGSMPPTSDRSTSPTERGR